MSDRDMNVRVTATDQASDDFQRIGRNATQMGREIDRASDQAERGFRGVGQAATQMERDVDRAESGMQRFSRTGAAVGAVMGSAAGVLSEFARAAAEEEVIFQRLESAVAATGESFDALSPAIERAISGAEELSFADDQAAAALTNLTTITGSTEEALNLLGLAMDVSRGRGISLAEAATLVGRAAEGQTAALTRMGIVLEEGATAQDALNELQRRYAGQSEAYADTTQGAIDRLKNSFDNWAESVGASTGDLQLLLTLLPGLSVGFSGLTTIVGGLAGALGPIGLIAAAVAAVGAVAVMTDGFGLFADETERTAIEVNDLTDAIYALAAAGASQAVVGMAEEIAAGWTAAQEAFNEYIAIVENYPEGPQQTAGTVEDLIPDPEQIEAANALLAALAGRLDDANFNAQGLTESVNFLVAQLLSGAITFEEFLRYLTLYNDQANDLFGTIDDGATSQQRLNDVIGAGADLLARWTGLAEHAAEVSAAVAAGEQAQAQAQAERDRAREDALATQQQQREETERDVQAAVAATDAAYALAESYAVQAVSLEEAAAAMGSTAAATLFLMDGMISAGEQAIILATAIGEDTAAISEYGSAIGQTNSALNDMEEARDILLERQAAGIALSAQEIDFLNQYDRRVATATENVQDWEVAQGLLAGTILDNTEAQEGLGEAMDATGEAIGDLVEPLTLIAQALAEIAGIDLDNLAPPEQTAVAWTELAMAISSARDAMLPTAFSAGVQRPTGEQGQAQQDTGPAAGAVKLVVDASQAFDQLQAVQDRAEFVMEGPNASGWTMEIEADGDQAFAVIRDVDGDAVRLVTEDRTVVINGDGLDAKEEIAEVSRQLANLHGDHASVYVDADTSGARAEINSLTGFQGTGYVVINGIGGTRVGPTDLTVALGGMIPTAANGRLIRAGEVGPEWIDYPGGGGMLAARDGAYVVPQGSYVHTAPQTRAMAQGGRGAVVNITVYAQDGRDAGRQIASQLRGIL